MRTFAPGWRVEHHVTLEAERPTVRESRVLPVDPDSVPRGGLNSELLRRAPIRGAREAVADELGPFDLRGLEALSPSTRRRGEARRWSLALTAYAYGMAIMHGSRHPNEDAAESLGIPPRAVRDRLYAARRHDPQLLTGGGRRGMIGSPKMTEFGVAIIERRMAMSAAVLGITRKFAPILRMYGGMYELEPALTRALLEAERHIPELWELEPEDVAARIDALGLDLLEGKDFELKALGITWYKRAGGNNR